MERPNSMTSPEAVRGAEVMIRQGVVESISRSSASPGSGGAATIDAETMPRVTPQRDDSSPYREFSPKSTLLEAGVAVQGQRGALDRHRLAVGGAQPDQVQHRSADRLLQLAGQVLVGGADPVLEHLGAGLDAAVDHVLAERRREHPGRPRLGDEGAAAGAPGGQALGHHPVHLLAHGHPGHAEALGQHALGRQHGADGEGAGEVLQNLADLVTLRPIGPKLRGEFGEVAGVVPWAGHEVSIPGNLPGKPVAGGREPRSCS